MPEWIDIPVTIDRLDYDTWLTERRWDEECGPYATPAREEREWLKRDYLDTRPRAMEAWLIDLVIRGEYREEMLEHGLCWAREYCPRVLYFKLLR